MKLNFYNLCQVLDVELMFHTYFLFLVIRVVILKCTDLYNHHLQKFTFLNYNMSFINFVRSKIDYNRILMESEIEQYNYIYIVVIAIKSNKSKSVTVTMTTTL